MRLDCAVYNYESEKLGKKLRLLHQFMGSCSDNNQTITIVPWLSKNNLEKFLFSDANRSYIDIGTQWLAFARIVHRIDDPLWKDLYLQKIETDVPVQGKGLAFDSLRAIAMIAEHDGHKILRLSSYDEYLKYYEKMGFVALYKSHDLTVMETEIKKSIFADFSQFKKDEKLTRFATNILEERGELLISG